MQSLKSRFFIWMIRNRHLFKLKLKPEIVDESFSVDEFRRDIDRASLKMKLAKGIDAQRIKISNIQLINIRKNELDIFFRFVFGQFFYFTS